MADEKKLKQARAVFKALCERLDEHNWQYEKDEDRLSIECGVQGDDLPMELHIFVNPDNQLVSLLSPMPFIVPENRRSAVAVAVCQANSFMVDGSFDFDYTTGKLLFRLTASYRESLISKEVFTYMISVSGHTIDEYNDKFLMIAKNDMTFEQIIEFID
ncbi:MAG: YbjN domain-containing protein [Clostridia bacterium]|nr:YbjN domain-containing protein [Clostridia bacterium]